MPARSPRHVVAEVDSSEAAVEVVRLMTANFRDLSFRYDRSPHNQTHYRVSAYSPGGGVPSYHMTGRCRSFFAGLQAGWSQTRPSSAEESEESE